MAWWIGWALLGAAGCSPDPSGDTDTPGDTDPEIEEAVGPCAGGAWGALTDPDAALHVREDGSATGAGTASDPLDDVTAALTLARTAGVSAILIGPGTFSANLELDARDDGLSLLGCADETTIEADEPYYPAIKVSSTAGLTIDGIALASGRRALWAWQGATVAYTSGAITGSERAAVLVDGELTEVTLTDVEISEVVAYETPAGAVVGYGVVVQDGSFTMSGGGISGATGVGLLADSATVTLTDVSVTDTSPVPDGSLGRAVHAQNLSTATITGGTFDGNADAAIFALRVADLVVSGATISDTAAGETAAGETTGDGIVVTAGDSSFEASSFLAELTGNTITGNARAAILVEGAAVEATSLAGNTYSGNGYAPDGMGAVVQDKALAPWADGYYDIDSEGVAPLDTNDDDLSADALD